MDTDKLNEIRALVEKRRVRKEWEREKEDAEKAARTRHAQNRARCEAAAKNKAPNDFSLLRKGMTKPSLSMSA